MSDESFTLRGMEFGSGQSYKVDLTAVKHANFVPVSRELLADAESMRSQMERSFRCHTHPWEFADRNPFPTFDPVPWFTSAVARAKALRQRVRDIRYVVRHGLPDHDEDAWYDE